MHTRLGLTIFAAAALFSTPTWADGTVSITLSPDGQQVADDGTLAGMNFYVEGIEGDIPQ